MRRSGCDRGREPSHGAAASGFDLPPKRNDAGGASVQVKLEGDGTMVAAHHLVVDARARHAVAQRLADQEIVDAPPDFCS